MLSVLHQICQWHHACSTTVVRRPARHALYGLHKQSPHSAVLSVDLRSCGPSDSPKQQICKLMDPLQVRSAWLSARSPFRCILLLEKPSRLADGLRRELACNFTGGDPAEAVSLRRGCPPEVPEGEQGRQRKGMHHASSAWLLAAAAAATAACRQRLINSLESSSPRMPQCLEEINAFQRACSQAKPQHPAGQEQPPAKSQ